MASLTEYVGSRRWIMVFCGAQLAFFDGLLAWLAVYGSAQNPLHVSLVACAQFVIGGILAGLIGDAITQLFRKE